MDIDTKEKLGLECRRIADELLTKAEKTDAGWTWSTMFLANGKEISWARSETIYNGTSGIVLLFIELYKYTRDKRYLEAALKGTEWVDRFCSENPTDYYALFTGRLGAAYTMVKMHELTGDEKYLDRSAQIAREANKFFDFARHIDDLINGFSGGVLGLLHIHSATGDNELLPIIDRYIEHLVRHAHHGEQGLYWDKSQEQVRGLCGFSHGASGIGFAFLELGHYFNNDAFYNIAEQAFLYETHHYDSERGNWPDFRKSYFDDDTHESFKEAYRSGNSEFFTRPSDMAAWCHGAPGIGLSRIRAFQLLKDSAYKEQLEHAIEKTRSATADIDSIDTSFTLCHGGGGNAMLFLDAYRALRDERYLQLAEKVAVRGLRSRKERGIYLSGLTAAGRAEDISLFMGNAGVAYFYLQLLDPLNVPSVLAPSVDTVVKREVSLRELSWITAGRRKLEKELMQRIFPRTIALIERLNTLALDACFSTGPAEMKAHFISAVWNIVLPSLTGDDKMKLHEIFRIELEKMEMDLNVSSRALLRMEAEFSSNAAAGILSLTNEQLLQKELEMHRDIKLIPANWSWNVGGSHKEEEEGAVLLKPSPLGVMEEPVQPFLQLILESFSERKAVKDALEEILSNFELSDEEEKSSTVDAVLQQIKQAMLGGLLVVSSLKFQVSG